MALHYATSTLAGNVRLTARRLGRGILDLLLPQAMLDTGEAALGGGLSPSGWSRIRFIEAPFCHACGAPFDHAEAGEKARCTPCEKRPFVFGRLRAAMLYDEHSRDLILRFKHGDRPELGGLDARWLSRAGDDVLERADAVLPVPLHRWRLFSRRYNQAAEIARPLARLRSLQYLPQALVRTRSTKSQGHGSARTRRLNVKGAFHSPGRRRDQVAGKRLVLIDDVFTTGATAEGCARALLQAGAVSVDVLVVARVRETGEVSI